MNTGQKWLTLSIYGYLPATINPVFDIEHIQVSEAKTFGAIDTKLQAFVAVCENNLFLFYLLCCFYKMNNIIVNWLA